MTGRAEPLDGFALITGASSGIGAAFAEHLAAEGRGLVLVARDASRLERFAEELRAKFHVAVEVLPSDLSTIEGCDLVAERIASSDKPVDTLVNNAGFTLPRGFGVNPLEDEQRMLNVLVTAVMRLTYAAIEPMRSRGRGEIINVSSVAGFVPNGRSATYSAAKAWVINFSEGVAMRIKAKGVQVTVVCPGFTHTEFHERAHLTKDAAPAFMWLDADQIAAEGLAAARAGKTVCVPSKRYRAIMAGVHLVPRPLLRRLLSRRR